MGKSTASATPRYDATEKLRKTLGFKVGKKFDNTNIREVVDRNGIAEFYTELIVEEALGDGFKITDVSDKVLDIDKKIQAWNEDSGFLKEYMQGVGYKRAFGKVGNLILDSGRLIVFQPDDLEIFTVKETGVIVGVKCTERIGLGCDDYVHNIGKVKTDPAKPTSNQALQLDRFFYRIQKQKRKKHEGKSVLEGIWDPLNIAEIIMQQAGYFSIAKAAGLKIVKADVEDAAEADKIITNIANMSETTVAVIPMDSELSVEAGGQADYEQLLSVPLLFITAKTGLPMAKLRGVIGGEQEGSITNIRSLYYNLLKIIQIEETKHFRDLIKIEAGINSWKLPGDFKVAWNFTQEQSEAEQTELLVKRASAIEALSQLMTLNEIREKVFGFQKLTHTSIPDDLPMAVYYLQMPIMLDIGGPPIIEKPQPDGSSSVPPSDKKETTDEENGNTES